MNFARHACVLYALCGLLLITCWNLQLISLYCLVFYNYCRIRMNRGKNHTDKWAKSLKKAMFNVISKKRKKSRLCAYFSIYIDTDLNLISSP